MTTEISTVDCWRVNCVATWLQTSILHLEYLFRILITLVHFSAVIPVHLFCLYANPTAVSYTVCFVTLWHLWAQTHPTLQGPGILPQEPPFWYNWSKHVESCPVFWFPLLWRSPGPHRPDMLYHRAACLTSRVLLRIVYITKKLLAKEIKAKAIIFTCLCLTSLNEKDPFYVKCTRFLMGYD